MRCRNPSVVLAAVLFIFLSIYYRAVVAVMAVGCFNERCFSIAQRAATLPSRQILIVKTSSMGDVLHTLPAVTDLSRTDPNLQIDWVVEERFAMIPRWHQAVREVIPVALRRWRKSGWQRGWVKECRQFLRQLRAREYDLIIDAQGLIKSAVWTRLARGQRCGLDWSSARESLASIAYQQKIQVTYQQHAVKRLRELVAKAGGYSVPNTAPDYGIDRQQFAKPVATRNVVLIHGTTWESKHWPEAYWIALAQQLESAGFKVQVCWGSPAEFERSQRIVQTCTNAEILPPLDITGVAAVLANASAAVAVDTGFMHLADALAVPLLTLFGPTHPQRHGPYAQLDFALSPNHPACVPCHKRQCHYASATSQRPACLGELTPAKVWQQFQQLLVQRNVQIPAPIRAAKISTSPDSVT